MLELVLLDLPDQLTPQLLVLAEQSFGLLEHVLRARHQDRFGRRVGLEPCHHALRAHAVAESVRQPPGDVADIRARHLHQHRPDAFVAQLIELLDQRGNLGLLARRCIDHHLVPNDHGLDLRANRRATAATDADAAEQAADRADHVARGGVLE